MRLFDLLHLLMLRFKLGDMASRYEPAPGTVAEQISGMQAERVGEVVGEVMEYCERIGFENGRDKARAIALRLTYRKYLPERSEGSAVCCNLEQYRVSEVLGVSESLRSGS
jgi:hypothetical protein